MIDRFKSGIGPGAVAHPMITGHGVKVNDISRKMSVFYIHNYNHLPNVLDNLFLTKDIWVCDQKKNMT